MFWGQHDVGAQPNLLCPAVLSILHRERRLPICQNQSPSVLCSKKLDPHQHMMKEMWLYSLLGRSLKSWRVHLWEINNRNRPTNHRLGRRARENVVRGRELGKDQEYQRSERVSASMENSFGPQLEAIASRCTKWASEKKTNTGACYTHYIERQFCRRGYVLASSGKPYFLLIRSMSGRQGGKLKPLKVINYLKYTWICLRTLFRLQRKRRKRKAKKTLPSKPRRRLRLTLSKLLETKVFLAPNLSA